MSEGDKLQANETAKTTDRKLRHKLSDTDTDLGWSSTLFEGVSNLNMQTGLFVCSARNHQLYMTFEPRSNMVKCLTQEYNTLVIAGLEPTTFGSVSAFIHCATRLLPYLVILPLCFRQHLHDVYILWWLSTSPWVSHLGRALWYASLPGFSCGTLPHFMNQTEMKKEVECICYQVQLSLTIQGEIQAIERQVAYGKII